MMNKISKIFIALLLVLVAVFGVAGCADTQSEMQSKIDELQSRIENLQSQNAEMQSQIEELEQELERMSDLLRENAKAGFYSLQEAYDMGLLTREDLMSIAYYSNYMGRWYNEDIMPEDYIPQPKTPEVLSEDIVLKIKELKAVCDNNDPKYERWSGSFAAEQYSVAYFGTYNGCIGVRTRGPLMAVQVISRVKIDNVTFILPDPAYEILIYVEGNK